MNDLTKNDVARFTWMFNHLFFLETSKGNYIWSDPDYQGGDNTIKPFAGTFKDFLKEFKFSFGRDKGKHSIKGYCGEEVKICK